jgi:hypothetical protein
MILIFIPAKYIITLTATYPQVSGLGWRSHLSKNTIPRAHDSNLLSLSFHLGENDLHLVP